MLQVAIDPVWREKGIVLVPCTVRPLHLISCVWVRRIKRQVCAGHVVDPRASTLRTPVYKLYYAVTDIRDFVMLNLKVT